MFVRRIYIGIKMVRNPGHAPREKVFGRSNLHRAIYGHRVAVDDFAVELFRQRQRQGRLPARRRPQQNHQQRVCPRTGVSTGCQRRTATIRAGKTSCRLPRSSATIRIAAAISSSPETCRFGAVVRGRPRSTAHWPDAVKEVEAQFQVLAFEVLRQRRIASVIDRRPRRLVQMTHRPGRSSSTIELLLHCAVGLDLEPDPHSALLQQRRLRRFWNDRIPGLLRVINHALDVGAEIHAHSCRPARPPRPGFPDAPDGAFSPISPPDCPPRAALRAICCSSSPGVLGLVLKFGLGGAGLGSPNLALGIRRQRLRRLLGLLGYRRSLGRLWSRLRRGRR